MHAMERRSATRTAKLVAAATLLAATCVYASPYPNPCVGTHAQELWCNVSQPLPARIADLLSRIPVAEKINMTTTWSGGSVSLDIAGYQWWNEALHGIADSPGVSFSGATPYATSFPQVITTAASFNTTLFLLIGEAIGIESRAFANAGNAGNTFWAPNINLFRDPRWGRGQETPGEDPFLAQEYVRHYVTGMQEGADPRYLQASACCKHFTAYDLESWNGTDRDHFVARVSEQDLVDSFQPAFQACVQDARVSGIMCSYNEVAIGNASGIPSCASEFLLNDVLRGEWGFNGYITSDCGAISDVFYTHNYTSTTDATCNVVLTNALDIGCDGFLPAHLQQALNDGAVTEADLDRALTNLFSVRFRLGQFDAVPQPYLQIGPNQVCTAPHQALNAEAAQQGIILLKNSGGALPLAATIIRTIAVIGPNANATQTMQANYFGTPCSNSIISPLAGLAAYASTVFVEGTGISNNDTSQFAQAVATASSADATVVVVGLDQTQESEGHDRTILSLPGTQNALIQQVCAAAKGPCIVVSMNGGPVDLGPVAMDTNVKAVLSVGYPGPFGGQAIARTIFGDNAPAGRLVYTVYPANYANQVSMFDMGMRPGASPWPPGSNPGRTYRFYTGQPVFEFGYGLAYTTFTYSIVQAPNTVVSLDATRDYLAAHSKFGARYAPLRSPLAVAYWVNVTNAGSMDSDDVVLGFITPPGAGTGGVPQKFLFGFQRVFVPAGQSVTVWLGVQARELTQVSPSGDRVLAPGRYTVQFGVESASQQGMGFAQHTFVAV